MGVDDNPRTKDGKGSIRFRAVCCDVKVESGVLRGGEAAQELTLTAKGGKTLDLFVEDAGDGPSFDHADWADARIELTTGKLYQLDELATGAESHSDLWSAQVQATLIRDVLTLQASWSDARDTLHTLVPLDGQRSDNQGGAFDLAYRPTPGHGALPQIDCHLRATYSGNNSVFAAQSSSTREWRVVLSFDFTWSGN